MLTEEVTCLAALNQKRSNVQSNAIEPNYSHGHDWTDLMNSYQQKISLLHDEINAFKQDIADRDRELAQLRIQNKILKQRSRSADRNANGAEDSENGARARRGMSVDGGGHLREQLDASFDEIRLLKNKLSRVDDELNNAVWVREIDVRETRTTDGSFRRRRICWRRSTSKRNRSASIRRLATIFTCSPSASVSRRSRLAQPTTCFFSRP